MSELIPVPAPNSTEAAGAYVTFYEAYLTNTPGTLSSPLSPSTVGTALMNDSANRSAFLCFNPNGSQCGHDNGAGPAGFFPNFFPAVWATDWYKAGGIILLFTDNTATNPAAGSIGVGGSTFDFPGGGGTDFWIVSEGLDSRNSQPGVSAAGTLVAPNGQTVFTNHVTSHPWSHIGTMQSICDYYQWGYPPTNSPTPSGESAEISSTVVTTMTSGGNPLPHGFGTILPILQLSARNTGYTGSWAIE
jgi:hypothetical protein